MTTKGQLIYLKGFTAPYKHKYIELPDAEEQKQAERTLYDIWGIGHWFQDDILIVAKERYCRFPTWGEIEEALTSSLNRTIKLKYV